MAGNSRAVKGTDGPVHASAAPTGPLLLSSEATIRPVFSAVPPSASTLPFAAQPMALRPDSNNAFHAPSDGLARKRKFGEISAGGGDDSGRSTAFPPSDSEEDSECDEMRGGDENATAAAEARSQQPSSSSERSTGYSSSSLTPAVSKWLGQAPFRARLGALPKPPSPKRQRVTTLDEEREAEAAAAAALDLADLPSPQQLVPVREPLQPAQAALGLDSDGATQPQTRMPTLALSLLAGTSQAGAGSSSSHNTLHTSFPSAVQREEDAASSVSAPNSGRNGNDGKHSFAVAAAAAAAVTVAPSSTLNVASSSSSSSGLFPSFSSPAPAPAPSPSGSASSAGTGSTSASRLEAAGLALPQVLAKLLHSQRTAAALEAENAQLKEEARILKNGVRKLQALRVATKEGLAQAQQEAARLRAENEQLKRAATKVNAARLMASLTSLRFGDGSSPRSFGPSPPIRRDSGGAGADPANRLSLPLSAGVLGSRADWAMGSDSEGDEDGDDVDRGDGMEEDDDAAAGAGGARNSTSRKKRRGSRGGSPFGPGGRNDHHRRGGGGGGGNSFGSGGSGRWDGSVH